VDVSAIVKKDLKQPRQAEMTMRWGEDIDQSSFTTLSFAAISTVQLLETENFL
jgi:hypothetical protein